MENPTFVAKEIQKTLFEELSLESNIEDYKDGSIAVRTNLDLNFVDYPIFMQVSCYKDNSINVCYIFGDCEPNNELLLKVNNFNIENEYLRVYVNKYLIVSYSSNKVDIDNDYVYHTIFSINNLLSDKNINLLKSIITYTSVNNK